MKCIVLAAGYATRLYPLTKDKPKPLLEVAGRSILDRITDKVDRVNEIDEIVIITNHKFYNHFKDWKKTYRGSKKVSVVNDGTETNKTRLGAIRDVLFAINELYIQDDMMILAGDNLFDFELTDFVDFFSLKKTDVVTAHVINDMERIKRTGVAEIDRNDQLISFEEKPTHPKSNYAVPPFYIYKSDTINLLRRFIDQGMNGDAPGMFLSWLLKQKPISVYRFEGNRYDIGTLDSYKEVQDIFKN